MAGGLLVYAPSIGIGQLDGDYGSFSRLSLDTYYPFYPDIGSSTKINYYTPRIGGFQAGVSYTPHLSDNGQSVVGLKPGIIPALSASAVQSSHPISGTPIFSKRSFFGKRCLRSGRPVITSPAPGPCYRASAPVR